MDNYNIKTIISELDWLIQRAYEDLYNRPRSDNMDEHIQYAESEQAPELERVLAEIEMFYTILEEAAQKLVALQERVRNEY